MEYPRFRNHFLPRTRAGRRIVALFVFLFLLAEPPVLFVFANRIEPFILGQPFLYFYLLVVYIGLIGTLLLALWRGV